MKRAVGVDLGDVRTGVSASDELRMLAHPRTTLKEPNPAALAKTLAGLLSEWDADTVVIGLPRNMDGTEGESAKKARAFAQQLGPLTAARIVLWDERMTTLAAHKSLQQAGRNARDSKGVVDQVAAQIILQSWLDADAGNAPG